MQTGFEGNKTAMIDRDAQRYAESLSHVDIWEIQECIDKIIHYEKREKDNYNGSRWRSRLNYVIERAAKEGVK